MTRTLEYLPLKAIADTGENPRQKIGSAELNELAASIGEHGVLQPILVERDGRGYKIVAGHRRVAAAAIAGLTEIPAQIEENGQNRRAAALTENIIRADLTPLEEALALAQLQQETGDGVRELARRIGKGKDWVSDRLRLAKLPDPVQERVAAGDIGLHAVPQIARLAELAPQEVEPLMQRVAAGKVPGSSLEDSAGIVSALDTRGYGSKKDTSGLVRIDHSLYPVNLPIRDAGKLNAKLKRANTVLRGYGSEDINLGDAAIDAARDAGCLIEIEYRAPWEGRPAMVAHFVSDMDWLGDQVRDAIDAAAEEAKRRQAAKKGETVKPSDAEQERRRKEREAEERKRKRARAKNLELGQKTAKAFKSPKITLEVAQLLARLALDQGHTSLAARGLRYVDEDLQHVEVRKNGSEKVTYTSATHAGDMLWASIEAAKTPEEVVGIVLRAFVCARYASEDVVPQSGRAYYQFPGEYGGHGPTKGLPQLVEKIAKAAKVVAGGRRR